MPVKSNPIKTAVRIQRQIYRFCSQFWLLSGRNGIVKCSDQASLILLFLQALVIALLLVATFHQFELDHRQSDRFARLWHCFTQEYEAYTQSNQTIIIEPLYRKCKQQSVKAPSSNKQISEPCAQKRASVLFLLGVSAIWLGVVNAAREIVSEKTILLRETRGSLFLTSYLSAKAFILYMIAFFQTGLLLTITCYFLPSVCLNMIQFSIFWFVLFITSIAATNLGLFISSIVYTEQAALTIVPILIIPQLFLGGLVRPVKYFSSSLKWGSDFILQKWSFKSLLASDSLSNVTLLEPNINFSLRDPILNFRYKNGVITNLFFGDAAKIDLYLYGTDQQALLMLVIHIIVPFILAYIVLKIKYS